jgi:hypothetical protein
VVEAQCAARVNDVLGCDANQRLLTGEEDIETLLEALTVLLHLRLRGVEKSIHIGLTDGSHGCPP